MTPEQIRQIIREELSGLIKSDRIIIEKSLLQFLDGRNIQTGLTTGTKIGTATAQKIGFWNTTPVIQQVAIAQPSGGVTQDAEARTAIVAILTALRNIGLIAT